MTRSGAREILNFAADPSERKAAFQQTTDGLIELTDGQNVGIAAVVGLAFREHEYGRSGK